MIGKWIIYDVEESGTRDRYHFAVVFMYTKLPQLSWLVNRRCIM